MEPSSNTLILKNIPKQVDDLTQLLSSLAIPAKEIRPFGRKRALLLYESESETAGALEKLKQLQFNGKLLNISLFCKDKPQAKNDVAALPNPKRRLSKCNKAVQTPSLLTENNVASMESLQIIKYVQKLYATDEDLSFDQPPPPYLKYQYPPINKGILDNICVSLLNNTKFYTQVLHLMNRMNLEPPFRERKEKYIPRGEPKEAYTQTEPVTIGEEKCTDSESEMESSDEAISTTKNEIVIPKRKQPPSDEQYKKKARTMLQTVKKLSQNVGSKSRTVTSQQEVFETKSQKLQSSHIQLNISTALATSSERSPCEAPIATSNITSMPKEIPFDLETNRIGEKEMQEMSVFKNYKQGEPSNKLYIKNLQKDVVTEDLILLYRQIIQNDNVQLDIKVMQHGRMKGQAFVSFSSDVLSATDLRKIVLEALIASNGLILRQKPMVVCFGKQT